MPTETIHEITKWRLKSIQFIGYMKTTTLQLLSSLIELQNVPAEYFHICMICKYAQ